MSKKMSNPPPPDITKRPPPPPPPPPKWPPNRLIYESDGGTDMCPACGSSLNRVLVIFKSENCINPECPNYFKYGKEQLI